MPISHTLRVELSQTLWLLLERFLYISLPSSRCSDQEVGGRDLPRVKGKGKACFHPYERSDRKSIDVWIRKGRSQFGRILGRFGTGNLEERPPASNHNQPRASSRINDNHYVTQLPARLLTGSIHTGQAIDFKDTYFHILIQEQSRKYLRFHMKAKMYQFKTLPFCLSTAPMEFTVVVQKVKLMAIHRRIRISST